MKFDKKKVEAAITAIQTCCVHCKVHKDDCPIVIAEDAMKRLPC